MRAPYAIAATALSALLLATACSSTVPPPQPQPVSATQAPVKTYPSTDVTASELQHTGWHRAADLTLDQIFDPVAAWEEQGAAPDDGWNSINMNMLVPLGIMPWLEYDTFQAWDSGQSTIWTDDWNGKAILMSVAVPGGYRLYASMPQQARWTVRQLSHLVIAMRTAFASDQRRAQYPLDNYRLQSITPSLPPPGGFFWAVLGSG